MATEDLLDHFKLEADVFPDCTVHSTSRYDRRRGLRTRTEKRWNRVKRVGDGAFGQVWLEEHNPSDGAQEFRAIKIIEKHKMKTFRIDYKKELLALAKFSKEEYRQAELLVSFLGWFENEQTIFLAMEYFEQGDLSQHISQISTEDEVRQITIDLLEGLKIIHTEGFAHRDLKPQNIFVVERPPKASRWWVKIGDFGISKRVKDDSTALRTQTGTPLFQAPEIWGFVDEDSESSVYSKAVDLWSLGCIVYNLAGGKVPFTRGYEINTFCRKRSKLVEEPLSRLMSAEGVRFVKHLLIPEPTDRMSIECALVDPWIVNVSADISLPIVDTIASDRKAIIYPENLDEKPNDTAKRDSRDSMDDTWKWTTMNTTETSNTNLQSANSASTLANESSIPTAMTSDTSWAEKIMRFTELPTQSADSRGFKEKVRQDLPKSNSSHVGITASAPQEQATKSMQHKALTRFPIRVPGRIEDTPQDDRSKWIGDDVEWQGTSAPAIVYENRLEAVTVLENGMNLVCTNQYMRREEFHIATRRRIKVGNPLGFADALHAASNLIALSPDGVYGASDVSQDIVLRNMVIEQNTHRLVGHKGKIKAITFSPKGTRIATGSTDCTIRVWNVSDGQLYRSFTDHTNVIVALAFSSDENLVLSGSADRTVRLWDTMNAKWPQQFHGHTEDICIVMISPDNSLVASSSTRCSVLLWDRETGSLLHTLTTTTLPWSLAFAPDTGSIACGLCHGEIMLFSTETGKCHSVIKSSGHNVRYLAFIPHLTMLLSAERYGNIRYWAPVRIRPST